MTTRRNFFGLIAAAPLAPVAAQAVPAGWVTPCSAPIDWSTSPPRMLIEASGRVGLGCPNPQAKLTVSELPPSNVESNWPAFWDHVKVSFR